MTYNIDPEEEKESVSWWLGCLLIFAIVVCIGLAVIGSLLLDSPLMMEVVK